MGIGTSEGQAIGTSEEGREVWEMEDDGSVAVAEKFLVLIRTKLFSVGD